MNNICIISILSVILSQSPQVSSDFIKVPYLGYATEFTIYGDVISHSTQPFNSLDRQTKVHETVHDINNFIRNTTQNSKDNGFYCLKGRGIIFLEPNIKKSQVKEFIPRSVRSNKFDLYIEGSPEWENQPLYIIDEWVAYTISGMSAVEDHYNNKLYEWRDSIFGTLELSIYSIALCMTIEKYDPEYWKNNTNFKKWMYWWLLGCENTYNAGKDLKYLKWDKQDQLLEKLRTNPDTTNMRNFIIKNFNGVWLRNKK